MSRFLLGASTGVNGLLTLSPQLVALVTLSPSEFGKFSLVYLIFAWGASVQMSVTCEPVARAEHRGATEDAYSAATWLALGAGLVAAVLSVVAWRDGAAVVLSSIAVIAFTLRVATRYHPVLGRDWRGVTTTDSVGLAAFVITFVLGFITLASPTLTVLLAWAVAGVAVVLGGPIPRIVSASVLPTWIRTHREQIAPLLKDSSVLDASSIGTPYLLAPLLGIAEFGVYRGLSNVAAPVRLLIEPLRPAWGAHDRTTLRGTLRWTSIAIAIPLGVLATLSLEAVGRLPWTIGVLTELSAWSVPAGMFVALSMISHIYYVFARLHASPQQLWRGRLVQSGSAIVLPCGELLVGGLAGAIWGFVLATAVGVVVWLRPL